MLTRFARHFGKLVEVWALDLSLASLGYASRRGLGCYCIINTRGVSSLQEKDFKKYNLLNIHVFKHVRRVLYCIFYSRTPLVFGIPGRSAELGLRNVHFVRGDILALPGTITASTPFVDPSLLLSYCCYP